MLQSFRSKNAYFLLGLVIEKRPMWECIILCNFWSNYAVLLVTNILFCHETSASSEFSLGNKTFE